MTYQPISDDDDLFGSAEEYDDSDSQNMYLKPTKAPNDNGFNGNSNNNHHYHHHQYNANNNNNANNARYNNVPLFGSGIGGVGGVGGGGGGGGGGSSNGASNNGNNAIVTRTEVRGSDNEVSAATASAANIIFAFYKQNSRNDNNNSYSNYKLLLVINLLISVFSRLMSS